jgi:hypothetical protein
MVWRFEICGACALGLLLGVHTAGAQSLAQVANESAAVALHELSQRADVIFAGRVIGVHVQTGRVGATGVVEIEFAVDDAVRGVHSASYTLREWAGLWTAGETPFRVGQRYLMLLHRPGAAGLGSPVGGQDGAVPIRGGVAGPGIGVPVPMVDLRWLAARVARPVAYAEEPARAAPTLRFSGPTAEQFGGLSPVSMRPNTVSTVVPKVPAADELPLATQGLAYATLLAMMREWEGTGHATR